MSNDQIIPVKGFITSSAFGDLQAESMEVVLTVGTLPSGSALLHDDEKILSERVAIQGLTEASGNIQREALEGADSTWAATLKAKDDELTSVGRLASGSTSLGLAENGAQVSWVGEDAVMNPFDGSIYDPKEGVRESQLAAAGVESTLSGLMIYTFDRMFKDYKEDEFQSVDVAERNRTHTLNQKAYEQIKKVLQNSTEDDGLDAEIFKAMGSSKAGKVELVNWVTSQLRRGGGSFFQTFTWVWGQFGRVYIPNPEGPGKFVAKRILMQGDAKELKVDAAQVRSSSFSPSDVFISRVLVTGTAMNYRRSSIRDAVGDAGNVVAIWPTQSEDIAKEGGVLKFPSPPWLVLGKVGDPKSIPGLTSDAILSNLRKAAKETDNLVNNQKAFLTAWAKNLYAWEVLSSSVLTLSGMPFKPDITVGERVEVKIELEDGSVTLCKGFIRAVRHTLSSGTAATYAEVSHVELGAFELQNK